jgi:hypothetical protein
MEVVVLLALVSKSGSTLFERTLEIVEERGVHTFVFYVFICGSGIMDVVVTYYDLLHYTQGLCFIPRLK